MKKQLFLVFLIISSATALAQPNVLKYVEYEFSINENQYSPFAQSLEQLRNRKLDLRFYSNGGTSNRITYSENSKKFTFYSFSLMDSISLYVVYSNTRITKIQLPTFIQNEQEEKKTIAMSIPLYSKEKGRNYSLNIPLIRFLVLNNNSCIYSQNGRELFSFILDYKEIDSDKIDLNNLKELLLKYEYPTKKL